MDNNHALQQAQANYSSIKELLTRKETATDEKLDEVYREIDESILDIELGYKVLLCWGDPAIWIEGKLNSNNEPITARLMYQDWGTTPQAYNDADDDVLIEYVEHFEGLLNKLQ